MHIKYKNVLIPVVLFFITSCGLDGDQLTPEEKNTVEMLLMKNHVTEWSHFLQKSTVGKNRWNQKLELYILVLYSQNIMHYTAKVI